MAPWLVKTLWIVGVYGGLLLFLWVLCGKVTEDPDDVQDDNKGDRSDG